MAKRNLLSTFDEEDDLELSALTVDAEFASTATPATPATPATLKTSRPKTPVLDRVKRQMEEEGFHDCQLGPNLAIPTAEFNGKPVHLKIVSS